MHLIIINESGFHVCKTVLQPASCKGQNKVGIAEDILPFATP
jgi:hypothetical protein